ncbi:hypothetical protein INT45_004251 [Circinella minor]|uniref:BZIP domain-containing protein n=1 Tax=Circinella minor TaxID=1195481 RepID=A0A8H7SFI4_9FUNG|nr:hypothetical protein INT45_004251 [Circinella minor]
MIHNTGQSSSRSSVNSVNTATATAAVSPKNTNFIFDTKNLSTPDFQDPQPSWNSNEVEQNKRKRNGSFDSVEVAEKPLPSSQPATATGDTQTLLSGFSNDPDNNGDQHPDIMPDGSLSLDALRKPGRKPLAENVFDDDDEDPKAKRKVQNRAAQRAFRERKERYVRDLEIKIRQIQTNHLHTTAQLTQENQYLRSVIHRLKAEVCAIKGLPMDSYADDIPTLLSWQQQQTRGVTGGSSLSASSSNGDLAPFLTMGSHALTHTISRSRPVAIAPAGTPPSPVVSNAKRSIAAAKRRPVAILPQKQEVKKSINQETQPSRNLIHQQSQTYTPNINNNPSQVYSSSSSSFNASSQPALYVQFSPEEKPQGSFNIHSNTNNNVHRNNHNSSTTDPYLSPDVTNNLFGHDSSNDMMLFSNTSSASTNVSNHHNSSSSSSSSSGSHGTRSPPQSHQDQLLQLSQSPITTSTTTTNATAPTRILPQKQDGTEKLVDEQETQQSRVQNVWRRLNLYGRFSDFDFDQLSRVAQMADHRSASQLPMADGRVPLMEDWELDKLMLQIDSDHL